MAVIKILVDTSVLIDYVRGRDEALGKLFRLQAEDKVRLLTSSVVVFEFYSGQSLQNKKIEEKMNKLFRKISILDLTEEIAKLAAKINRENKLYDRLAANDLLIGASAIYFQAKLITKNKKDFKLIPNLELFTF